MVCMLSQITSSRRAREVAEMTHRVPGCSLSQSCIEVSSDISLHSEKYPAFRMEVLVENPTEGVDLYGEMSSVFCSFREK